MHALYKKISEIRLCFKTMGKRQKTKHTDQMLILCPPGAMSSLRIEDSPFGPYDFINPSNSPISPPGSVGDGWPTRAKSPHASSNVNWPPGRKPFLCVCYPNTLSLWS